MRSIPSIRPHAARIPRLKEINIGHMLESWEGPRLNCQYFLTWHCTTKLFSPPQVFNTVTSSTHTTMSLGALQMASTGNPVTRLYNSNNIFLISATAIATLHFGLGMMRLRMCRILLYTIIHTLAFRVTALRLTVADPEKWKRSTPIGTSYTHQSNNTFTENKYRFLP